VKAANVNGFVEKVVRESGGCLRQGKAGSLASKVSCERKRENERVE